MEMMIIPAALADILEATNTPQTIFKRRLTTDGRLVAGMQCRIDFEDQFAAWEAANGVVQTAEIGLDDFPAPVLPVDWVG